MADVSLGTLRDLMGNTPIEATLQNEAAAVGNGTDFEVAGYGSACLQISGEFEGAVLFQGSVDGLNFISTPGAKRGGMLSDTATTPGLYDIDCRGLKKIRARVDNITSGAITVVGTAEPFAGNDSMLIGSTMTQGEVISNNNRFTPFPVNENHEHLILIQQKKLVNGTIRDIHIDGEYIYIISDNNKIQKYNRLNYNLVAETDNNNEERAICVDDLYVYSKKRSGGIAIKKYLKTDLSLELEKTFSLDRNLLSMVVDDNYLYCGFNSLEEGFCRVDKATLGQEVCDFLPIGDIWSIDVDEDYIYTYYSKGPKMCKIDKTDFTIIATSGGDIFYNGGIHLILVDGEYIYAAGNGKVVYKLLKSDLSLVHQSVDLGFKIRTMKSAGPHLLIGGIDMDAISPNRILKLSKDNLSVKAAYGGTGSIQTICTDGKEIMHSTGAAGTIYKFNHLLYENLYWGRG